MDGISIKLKQLFNHQGFRKYFANTSWLFGEKLLRLLVGFTVGVWVARYLGPENYGLLSYAQSFVGLFSAIAMLGLDGIVVKELINNPNKEDLILSTSFILKLITAIALILTIILIAPFFNSSLESQLIYILSIGWLFQAFNVIDFYFQSKVLGKFVVIANAISLLVSSIFKIIFILFNVSLIWFAFTFVFDNLFLALGYIYFFFKVKRGLIKLKFDLSIAKDLLHQSWPLILSSLSFVIYNNIDKIILQKMLSSYEVGLYTAGSYLFKLWHFVPGIIITSLTPFLMDGMKKGENLFYKRLKLISSILIWIALILAIIYTSFSKEIIILTFGKEYVYSSNLIIILIWANVFIFFNSVWNRWQLLENNPKVILYYSSLVSFINIILNYLLISKFRLLGAAYALIISLFIVSFIFYILVDKRAGKLFINSLLWFFKDVR